MTPEQEALVGYRSMAVVSVVSDCRILRDLVENFIVEHGTEKWMDEAIENLATPLDLTVGKPR